MRSSLPWVLSWKQLARLLLWYFVDSLSLLVPAVPHESQVLLVRLDNIGDFVLWLRAAQDVTRFYHAEGKFITLVASSPWASWAEDLGLFDRVISLDRTKYAHNPLFRLRFNRALRRLGAGTVVVPGFSRDWWQGDTLARVSGAATRIASDGDPAFGTRLERVLSRSWYTRLLPASQSPMMEVDRNAEFATQLTHGSEIRAGNDLTTLYSTDHMRSTVAGFGLHGPFYILVAGASEGMKRWPLENFRETVRRLHARTGWLGVLCGSAAEYALAEQVSSEQTAPTLNLCGKTTLPQLAALLANASIVIANDTAAVHMAASVGTPTVCVLGGGHVGRFLPYSPHATPFANKPTTVIYPMECFGCHWSCIYPLRPDEPAPCVRNVSIEAVWQAILSFLEPASFGSRDKQRLEVQP